jgi:hypothetical protein
MNVPSAPEALNAASGSFRRVALWLLAAFSAAGLVWSVLIISIHTSYKADIIESTKANLLSLTGEAVQSIDAILREAMNDVDSTAAELSAGKLSKDSALERMRNALDRNPRFYGSTVTYRPFGFDPKRRLYSCYLVKKSGRTEYVQLDSVYDYTKSEYDWFGPALEGGPLWTQPYYDDAAGTYMVTYSAPFYENAGASSRRAALGVVTVDISMDNIRRIIETLNLGPMGFGALVSQKGVYLYHPNSELVLQRKNLAQVAKEQGDVDRLVLAERAQRKEKGIMDHRSTTTGLTSWLIYAPIPSTGWSLQNTFVKDDLPWDVDRLRRQLITMTIALLVFAIPAIALVIRAYDGSSARLWSLSVLAALLLISGIGRIWSISLEYDSRGNGEGVRISDRATLSNLMNAYLRSCTERHTEPPVFIPTGIFIESASFPSASDFSVTGYLWQKYTLGVHDGLTRGFTVSDATSLNVTENYREKEGNTEVVRWYFNCSVRQRVDHAKYPLEQQKISLRIQHKDLNHNVVLVPDLGAYKLMNPTSLPGLEQGLNLPGWQLTQSFFELRNKRYDTNFGLERSLAKENFPALYFSITIRRVFVDAFISNLTPLIIVTILLFTLLMIAIKDERLVGFMQAGSGRVLNICVAMFFVIAFAHIDIRRRIAAEEVFYLEYFYFLIYVTMLWISINSVLFAMGKNIRLIQYRENLISKLLFWPFLLGLMFAITVFAFY